jgi:hypothetical protein
LFGADWCKPCSEFIPVLDRLYLVQAAQGVHRLEIVLVSRCRDAKATKYYGLGMPWRAMYHDAKNKAGMNMRTAVLMAKFRVTTIPALILLDKHGHVICAEGRGWCVADPKGLAFPWREKTTVGPVGWAVINFDLPPAKQGQQPEPPEQALGANRPRGENLGAKRKPVLAPAKQGQRPDSPERTLGENRPRRKNLVAKRDPMSLPPASDGTTAVPDMGPPPNFGRTRAEDIEINTDVRRWANGTPLIALPPARGTENVHARMSNRRTMGKWKAAPPDKVTEPQPPPKPNFGICTGPHGELNTQPEGKPTSLMQSQTLADVHPFTPTLKE